MPNRNISLTPEQDAFIEKAVKSGEYQNASEAVRDAIRALRQRRREDALKLERLRRSIDTGLADLDRGDYEEVDDAELETWLERLVDPARSLRAFLSMPLKRRPRRARTMLDLDCVCPRLALPPTPPSAPPRRARRGRAPRRAPP